jgi:pilus assembly protein Flp/PilA
VAFPNIGDASATTTFESVVHRASSAQTRPRTRNKERTMHLLRVIAIRLRREDGATMVEYGLMVALIAIVAMVGAGLLGIEIDAVFDAITAAL